MSLTTLKDLSRLQESLREVDFLFPYVGMRVVDSGYDDYDAEVGSVLEPSRYWVEGEWTDDLLAGTSCISLNAKISSGSLTGYTGRRVLVIGGQFAEYGEDAGELVIRDAVVLAIVDL